MQFRGSGIYSMGYKTFKDGIEKKTPNKPLLIKEFLYHYHFTPIAYK